ncbi:hypothetical protein C8Q76DRAFT_697852 [Earliella scabrosa]|nr:hypothetical protein C8Q76DRAFT_697852 [Earliella scabrosa]
MTWSAVSSPQRSSQRAQGLRSPQAQFTVENQGGMPTLNLNLNIRLQTEDSRDGWLRLPSLASNHSDRLDPFETPTRENRRERSPRTPAAPPGLEDSFRAPVPFGMGEHFVNVSPLLSGRRDHERRADVTSSNVASNNGSPVRSGGTSVPGGAGTPRIFIALLSAQSAETQAPITRPTAPPPGPVAVQNPVPVAAQNPVPIPTPRRTHGGSAARTRVPAPAAVGVVAAAPAPVPAPAPANTPAYIATAVHVSAAVAALLTNPILNDTNDPIFPFQTVDRPDPNHSDKWYAVLAGTRVGVFQYWEEASQYVLGKRGNWHKGHSSYESALEHYVRAKEAGRVRPL